MWSYTFKSSPHFCGLQTLCRPAFAFLSRNVLCSFHSFCHVIERDLWPLPPKTASPYRLGATVFERADGISICPPRLCFPNENIKIKHVGRDGTGRDATWSLLLLPSFCFVFFLTSEPSSLLLSFWLPFRGNRLFCLQGEACVALPVPSSRAWKSAQVASQLLK